MKKFPSQSSRSMDQLGRFAYLKFSVKAGVANILTKALFVYNFLQGVDVSEKNIFTFRFGHSTFSNYFQEKKRQFYKGYNVLCRGECV